MDRWLVVHRCGGRCRRCDMVSASTMLCWSLFGKTDPRWSASPGWSTMGLSWRTSGRFGNPAMITLLMVLTGLQLLFFGLLLMTLSSGLTGSADLRTVVIGGIFLFPAWADCNLAIFLFSRFVQLQIWDEILRFNNGRPVDLLWVLRTVVHLTSTEYKCRSTSASHSEEFQYYFPTATYR